jgi:AcrR family transcriptional regulator
MDRMNMGVPLPRKGHRERKKQRTREKLIDAALRLFIERGYEETRIDDIVAEVDIVPRTFFRYFSSKDDALFGWYEEISQDALAALRSRPRGEGVVSALAAALLDVAYAHREQQRISIVVYHVAERSTEIRARWSAWRHDLQRDLAGVLKSRLPPSASLVAEMTAAAVNAAFSASSSRWAADGAVRPLPEYWSRTTVRVLELLEPIDDQYVLL